MSEYLHKSHNVTVLIYHLVLPAKYRRAVFDEAVDGVIKDVCLDIEKRYQLKFMEIGTDKNHVHFLVQSVPTYSVTKIVTMLKSLTAREVFKRCPVVNKQVFDSSLRRLKHQDDVPHKTSSDSVYVTFGQRPDWIVWWDLKKANSVQ